MKATLLITRSVTGTSTNIARERVVLRCSLQAGHSGPHHDSTKNEHWEATGDRPTTLLRQEEADD